MCLLFPQLHTSVYYVRKIDRNPKIVDRGVAHTKIFHYYIKQRAMIQPELIEARIVLRLAQLHTIDYYV